MSIAHNEKYVVRNRILTQSDTFSLIYLGERGISCVMTVDIHNILDIRRLYDVLTITQ